MIGWKSVAALAIGVGLVASSAARGVLDPRALRHHGAASCFMVALVARLAVGLIAVGWRFEVRSRGGLTLRRGRLAIVDQGSARELPAAIQRLLLLAGIGSVALGALGSEATARIARLPAQLATPSISTYCTDDEDAATAPPQAAPPPLQAGCALVRRAFQLGYKKTLGACAPHPAVASAAPTARPERCARRQLDEPFLHYAFRRAAAAIGAATSVAPVTVLEHRIDDVRARLDHLDTLLSEVHGAITGEPHAAHHLWTNLPDPHPGSARDRFTGAPRCAQRFADLPLWPRWQPSDRARLVEHVLGQLLFATRFGSTASCSDYTIHWDAPLDTCTRLAVDPSSLAGEARRSIDATLERRRRQIEIGQLDVALGRAPRPRPPEVAAIVSLQCFMVVPSGDGVARGQRVRLDGEEVSLRQVDVAAVREIGAGPVDVYLELAALLGGADPGLGSGLGPGFGSGPRRLVGHEATRAEDLGGGDFLLTRLDQLADDDPLAGARWPLERPDLIAVFPFERHLHGFIDGFRRRYLAQRGRL